MITVQADKQIKSRPLLLVEVQLNLRNVETVEDLGTYNCQTPRHYETFKAPICLVRMISGQILYVNAVAKELEARST